MAQNITLNGASYPDVPSILLPKTGGGMASFVDISDTDALPADVASGRVFYKADGTRAAGTYLWDWRGEECEALTSPTWDSGEIALKDTVFDSWTPSTTAKTIISSATATTFTAQMSQYDYLLRWQFRFNAAYVTGATYAAIPISQYIEIWQALFRRPSNIANIVTGTRNGSVCTTLNTPAVIKYYNATSAETIAYTGSYGIYAAAAAATFSSATVDSPTVTIKTPTVSARCSNTYMTTARAAELDKTNSKLRYRCAVFRTKQGAVEDQMYRSLVALYNNPF